MTSDGNGKDGMKRFCFDITMRQVGMGFLSEAGPFGSRFKRELQLLGGIRASRFALRSVVDSRQAGRLEL